MSNGPAKKAAAKPVTPVKYRILARIAYDGEHKEIGDIVTDIPETTREWLLSQNYIEKVD